MTLDDRDFKLYKGLELVASGTIPDVLGAQVLAISQTA